MNSKHEWGCCSGSLSHTHRLPACLPTIVVARGWLMKRATLLWKKCVTRCSDTFCWHKQALTRTATNFVVSGATLCAPRLETWCTLLMRGWTSLWATLTCALHSDLRACQQASQRRGWGSRSRVAQAALMCLPSQHANPTAAVKNICTSMLQQKEAWMKSTLYLTALEPCHMPHRCLPSVGTGASARHSTC